MKSSGQQLTKNLWASCGLAGLFPLKTLTSALEPSAILQNALSKHFFPNVPMSQLCIWGEEFKHWPILPFLIPMMLICYAFIVQRPLLFLSNDSRRQCRMRQWWQLSLWKPCCDVLPESVWTPSAAGHSGLCWWLLVWSQTLYHRFSDLSGNLQKTHTHVYRLHLTWPVRLIETFLAFLFRKTEAKRQNETALDGNRGVGRSAGTSAGEGHPSIFFLGRCALVGSSCSDRKRGGSRQGAAVVIEFSTWGHHHAVVVGKQWELYREGERLRGKQNDHKTCLTNMDTS